MLLELLESARAVPQKSLGARPSASRWTTCGTVLTLNLSYQPDFWASSIPALIPPDPHALFPTSGRPDDREAGATVAKDMEAGWIVLQQTRLSLTGDGQSSWYPMNIMPG